MIPLHRCHFAIAEECEVEDSAVVCWVLEYPALVTMMMTMTTRTLVLLLLLCH